MSKETPITPEALEAEVSDGIKHLEGYKHQYPKMHTQDVIDMMRRLHDKLRELTKTEDDESNRA